MIPKIIHYCWLSDDAIPDENLRYIEGWKNILTDYKFVLWDRKRFDVNSLMWTKSAFAQKKYAFAADYIRLFAVYTCGGIYLDCDIEVLKKFDDILNRKEFFGFEGDECFGIEAGCFGAEKGNSFIGKVLAYYENRSFDCQKQDDTKPLPLILQELSDDVLKNNLFSSDYFTAKSQRTGEIKITKNTYVVHHFSGSWLNSFERDVLVVTQKINRTFGENIFSKLLTLGMLFPLRIKHFGVQNVMKYYFKTYILTKQKNRFSKIKTFFS